MRTVTATDEPTLLPVLSDPRPIEDRAYHLGRMEGRLQGLREKRRSEGPAGLIAAARTLDLTSQREAATLKRRQGSQTGGWQDDAWLYYDVLSEIKQGARFKGRSLAKLALFPAIIQEGEHELVPLDTEVDGVPVVSPQVASIADLALQRLGGGKDGHRTMLERWGQNGFVVGEGYLVGWQEPDAMEAERDRFAFASIDEITVSTDGRWTYRQDPGAGIEDSIRLDPATSLVVRIWYQHARYSALPDSPVAGVLDHCEHLLTLQQESLGAAMSRMNNGVLLVPRGATVHGGRLPDSDGTDGEAQRSITLDDLLQHIITPIGNPRSASAAAPIIISADPEDIEKFRHMTFGREFDKISDARISALIDRIGNGVDLPKEVLTGQLGEANHWSAWLITDSQFRDYVQPDADQFVEAITVGYFRPALLAANVPADLVARMVVGYDASALVADPDESDNAFRAVEVGLIGDAAARRRIGYSEAEAPTDEELARRTAAPSTDQPDDGAVDEAGGTGDVPDTEDALQEALTAAATRTTARLDRLGRRWADRDRQLRNRLLSAADAAMTRALDRAGARLRSRLAKAKHSPWRDVIDGRPNREIASLVGPAAVTAAIEGDDPSELIEAEFDELITRFRSQVGRAQATTRRELAELGLDDEQIDRLERTQAEDRDQGAELLLSLLVGLATQRLFDPRPAAPPIGEYDPELSVPAGIIRESLSVAGGARGEPTRGGAFRSPDERIAGQLATGQTVADFAREIGLEVVGYTWDYGDASSRQFPFSPHELLDGTEFAAWDDPALANSESFPEEAFYFPGDHSGCQCDVVPRLAETRRPGDE
jgi:hypothetical protein